MTSPRFGNWQHYLDETLQTCLKDNSFASFCREGELSRSVSWIYNKDIIRATWIVNYMKLSKKNIDRKSTTKSEDLRKKGNDHYKAKQLLQALELYTQSVCYAPASDSAFSLGLAYANRSAVLYHMEYYQECVDDIQLALHAGYPADMTHKLSQRWGQCLYQLERYTEAHKVLEDTRSQIKDLTGVETKRKDLLLKEAETWLLKIKDKVSVSPDVSQVKAEDLKPSLTGGSNPASPSSAAVISLTHSAEKGRHFIANRDIKPGDTLLIEEPYAAVLIPSHKTSHCHNCFSKLLASVPCHQCVQVRYCSPGCRDSAWSRYHQKECVFLDLLNSVGVAHLSFRVILNTGVNQLLDFREEYDSTDQVDETKAGYNKEGVYDGSSYLAMYELMTHAEDVDKQDMFQYAMTAALLLECLKQSSFFESVPKETADPEEPLHVSRLTGFEKYVGGLLLRHMLQLICNAQAITELHLNQEDPAALVATENQVRIATAIYPTHSMMNHSCDPDVINSFQRGVLITRAFREVPSGSEVYNCYGPHCRRMNHAERQNILQSQYFFTCTCGSCQSDLVHEQIFQAYKCTECQGPVVLVKNNSAALVCLDCEEEQSYNSLLKSMVKAEKHFKDGLMIFQRNKRKALKELLESLAVNERLLYHQNKQLGDNYDAVARCYAEIGQYRQAVEYLKKSISIVEAIYGSNSIELANELHKLMDVQVNAHDPGAMTSAVQALKIFDIHYGKSNKTVQNLQEMIQFMKSHSL